MSLGVVSPHNNLSICSMTRWCCFCNHKKFPRLVLETYCSSNSAWPGKNTGRSGIKTRLLRELMDFGRHLRQEYLTKGKFLSLWLANVKCKHRFYVQKLFNFVFRSIAWTKFDIIRVKNGILVISKTLSIILNML